MSKKKKTKSTLSLASSLTLVLLALIICIKKTCPGRRVAEVCFSSFPKEDKTFKWTSVLVPVHTTPEKQDILSWNEQ